MLLYYAVLVCTSCIFSHLFLGNRVSSFVTEIYSYCKTRAWLYCKVFNKEHNIVILFKKKTDKISTKNFLTIKHRH